MRTIIRLYTSEVQGFVSAWLKEPPPEQSLWRRPLTVMVVDNLNPKRIRECIEILKPLGCECMPGLALGPSVEDKTAGWFKKEHWQLRAQQLDAIAREFHNVDPFRIHFELENFHDGNEATFAICKQYGGTEALYEAMRPFLDVMGELGTNRRWVPYMCPGDAEDVAMRYIASRSHEVYLLDEDQFAFEVEYRKKPAESFADAVCKLAKRKQSIEGAFPRCTWVPGLFEDHFRKWGERWVKEVSAICGDTVWLYNNDKNAARAGLIPGTAWYNGTNASTLNDCAWFPFDWSCPREGWNGEPGFSRPSAGSKYYLERTATCTTNQSFTFAVTIDQPGPGHRSIASVWLPDDGGGWKEWQLRTVDGFVYFDWMEKGKDGTAALNVATAGRYIVSWSVITEEWKVSTPSVSVTIPAPNQLTSNQPLRLGYGTTIIDGKRQKIYGDGLEHKDGLLWNRALGGLEHEAAKKGCYPWL